jgi:hypothetical protein
MDQAEYDAEYEKARKELDEAAEKSTTARDESGKFAKATPEPETVEEKKPDAEPVAEIKPEPEVKPEPEPDPIEDLRKRLEKAEKIAKDNQAWATRMAQERAQEKRDREKQEREANRPEILAANPGLEEAIKFVVPEIKPEPNPQEELAQKLWERDQILEKAHPGILSQGVDPELVKGILARYEALGEESLDPLACIREITAEKLAHAERVVGKRFAAETAKAAQKNAMSVPGAGGSAASKTAAPDTDLEAVSRIANMTDAEFAKEVRRVKGY